MRTTRCYRICTRQRWSTAGARSTGAASPVFDSDACIAALLGDREHGRWLIAQQVPGEPTRRYRDGSLVLETEWYTAEGRARVIDTMPIRGEEAPAIVRIVEGLSGRVSFAPSW